jgi:hypothetical protein
MEATCIGATLATEMRTGEANAEWDSAALLKGVEDRAALGEREALEMMSRAEEVNDVAIASTREDAKGVVQKIVLHEGKLVVEHPAPEVSEREHREQFEELTLLQTQGSKLCHTVICPSRARHHLSEGMQLIALHHTEMARELIALWEAVSSATELVLGHSPSDTFRVGEVGELAAKFQKMEERWSRLERLAVRIYDLLLRPPPSHLDEATEQLRLELAARWEVDAKLEDLQALAA